MSSAKRARDSNGVDRRGGSIPLERLRLYRASATGTQVGGNIRADYLGCADSMPAFFYLCTE